MTTLSAFARAISPNKTLADLPSVTVPLADPATGIIKIADLVNDIAVIVPKSASMRSTDSIVLTVNTAEVSTPLDLSTVDLTDPNITEFTLLFRKSDFPLPETDESVPLTYYLYDTAAEDGQYAPVPTMVRFDQLAPGGAQLPPLYFTPAQQSGITVADIINGQLPFWVDPFFGSERYDFVELSLGTDENTVVYITPTFEVTEPKGRTAVSISETDLRAAPDGEKWFGYRVKDFAGNVSQLSELTMIPVFLNLPTLKAPIVPEYDDTSLITYTDAYPDVGVNIPTYDGAAVGDNIYVIWGAITLPPYTLTPNDVGNTPTLTTILVPYATVLAVGNGDSISVSYILRRADGQRVDSPATTVAVNLETPGGTDPDPDPETPEHDYIKPPELKCGSSPANTILPGDFGKDAVVTIYRARVKDNNPIWKVGDIIQFYYGNIGAPLISAVPVTTLNEPANITINVPYAAVIEAVGVGDIPIYFTVTRQLDPQNAVTVESPRAIVKVTSAGELPGEGTLALGEFPEANANNIIVRRVTWDGTTFRIPLAGVSNIELTKSPKLSYNFVGLVSGDSIVPIGAPIEATRQQASDIPITQAMITNGHFELALPWSLLYQICRNGATLDYSLSNDSGLVQAPSKFVRMALNVGGGICELDNPPAQP
ncbi:hypothetical protein [Pseudomonas sp. PS02290]|uniref:hypothetical protein n=1 Tax=Pseudomonas sp. PS02290 TaxID=2991430 RepID=UPI00249B3FDC|nr:hypothetical protein [Pseudomonas sp. PS02290]